MRRAVLPTLVPEKKSPLRDQKGTTFLWKRGPNRDQIFRQILKKGPWTKKEDLNGTNFTQIHNAYVTAMAFLLIGLDIVQWISGKVPSRPLSDMEFSGNIGIRVTILINQSGKKLVKYSWKYWVLSVWTYLNI